MMTNRSHTFFEEVTDQMGVFFSIVFGFIVANAWNSAIRNSFREDDLHGTHWPYIYALLTLIVAVSFMSLWSYFVVRKTWKGKK
jgi:hypothetical protein